MLDFFCNIFLLEFRDSLDNFSSVRIDFFIDVVDTIINMLIAAMFTIINITATTEPLILL